MKDVLVGDNIKYSKSETKALFLINESAAELRNVLINNRAAMPSIKPKRFSAVIIVQNSLVQIIDPLMLGSNKKLTHT